MKINFLLIYFYFIKISFLWSCPNLIDLRSDFIKKNFDLNRMTGQWYEISYKDIFQPSYNIGCYSNKIKQDEKNRNALNISFSFLNRLSEKIIRFPLFSEQHEKGHFFVSANFFKVIKIPSTVIEIGLNDNGEYEWYVELKCLDFGISDLSFFFDFWIFKNISEFLKKVKSLKFIYFTEVQIMSRKNKISEELYSEILDKLRHKGLGDFVKDLKLVNHEKCIY
jgi:hypothetical protein